MKIIILLISAILVLGGCSNNNEEQYDMTFFFPYNESSVNYPEEVNQFLEEQTGYSINYIAATSVLSTEKLMLELSIDNQYALVKTEVNNFEEVTKAEQALDLKPYLEEYGQNILNSIPDWAWETVTDPETGAIYGIPSVTITYEIPQMIYYRKDIMEEKKIKVPTNLEEFKSSICTAADGQVITPFAIPKDTLLEQRQLMAEFGINYYWNEVDGNLEYMGNDENFYEYIDYMKELYQCNGFGYDFGFLTQNTAMQSFINGDSLYISASPYQQQDIANGLAALGIDYYDAVGVLPPFGDTPMNAKNASIDYVSFIPVYMEELAVEVIQTVNIMFSEEFLDELYATNSDGSYVISYPSYYLPAYNYEYQKQMYEESMATVKSNVESGEYTVIEWARYEQFKYMDNTVQNPLTGIQSKYYLYDTTRAMNMELDDTAMQFITDTDTLNQNEYYTKMLDMYNYQEIYDYVNNWYSNK